MGEKKRIIIDNRVFDFVYSMAVNDAMNRVSNLKAGDKEKLEENDSIKGAVKDYAENVINGEDAVFEKTNNIIINSNNGEVECLNFGKIQKLINMTMKYLYIKYYDTDLSSRFDICYAPMDSIMRDFVFESYYVVQKRDRNRGETPGFDKECSWSALSGKVGEFESYQKAIDYIIEKKGLNINRIEFDIRYWGQAKKILNDEKTVKKQREKIKDLWKSC